MDFEIFLDGELINTIHASEEFTIKYCKENGYTYSLRPAVEEKPDPDVEADRDALLVDLAYRIALLEMGGTADAGSGDKTND